VSGLRSLHEVELAPHVADRLESQHRTSLGSPAWRRRKRAEARDLLALTVVAPRFKVIALDLRTELLALVRVRVPVACAPGADGELRIEDEAVLALRYPQDALRGPQPGYDFVQVRAPSPCWHPNIPAHPAQPLCLGDRLPAGVRVRELVLMSYAALSMQTIQIDTSDPAGVMNVAAARWWQENLHCVPLSREPFLGASR